MDIDAVYKCHGHSVLRRARRILGDENDAQEVLQEVFLDLLERPAQFQGRSSMTTFLYSSTTHRCLNRLRDQRNRQRILGERVVPMTGSVSAPNDGPSTETRVTAQELLSRLPLDEAQAAIHYFFDDMSHEEIAAVMQCSRRHVGDLLARISDRGGAS